MSTSRSVGMPMGLVAIAGTEPAHAGSWAPEGVAMAPIANRPLAGHAIDALRRAGADEIVMVGHSGTAAALHAALGAESEELRWVETPRVPDVPGAILAAAPLLGVERFLLHVAEGLVLREHDLLRSALADDSADAVVFFHDDRLAGVHAFGPAIMEHLEQVAPGPDGRRALADAVDLLADAGGRVQAGVLAGWWAYGARPDDLLRVNRLVLDRLEDEQPETGLAETRIEGRVRLHPTARVRNAVIRGPAIIGAHALVTDAYVGPYTAIGDRAAIENAEIASSIVLPGARIRHVGVRVEDSIVGPNARVGRDFSLPKAMRLLVGRDAQVTLS